MATKTTTWSVRDRATLEWIGWHRHVAADQVHRWWRLESNRGLHPRGRAPSKAAVYRRLLVMRDGGVLDYERPVPPGPGVYSITRRGLDAVAAEAARTPRTSWARLRHEHDVAELELDYLEEGHRVATDRQLRRRDRLDADPPWAIRVAPASPSADGKRHYPDLVLEEASAAIEVELTAKASSRLGRLLAGYRRSGRYGELLYFSHEAQVRRKVADAAAEARLGVEVPEEDRSESGEAPTVHVLAWEPRW